MTSSAEMPFGAALLPQGGVRFRLWAPSSSRVELEIKRALADDFTRHGMRRIDGWHELELADARAGSHYRFVVQTTQRLTLSVPDPASRSNPQGVHAASVVIDPNAYRWRTLDWQGRAWADAVLYELHIGAFTREGTFAAAAARLEDLKALGISALQLMPLAAFPGERSWGYDGVLQFAPAASYGTPQDLKALIDQAHSLGLMVLLDVVYNHFGPEGNYLHAYCPEFFNFKSRTPWGAAINFDGEHSRTVRDFFVCNALYWIEEYRFDGLRLDAVHAMRDTSSPDIVGEITAAIHAGPGSMRQVHVVLENNANQARYLRRDAAGKPRMAAAQWDDDVHHALHVLTSAEVDGYYADYAVQPLARLGRSLAEGFAYQGEYSTFRDRVRGEPSAGLPPAAFVAFLQNHDMVGNRAFGNRLHEFADARLVPAAYACLLLSPLVPMLFMGEEYAASTPFMFFCDFGVELAESVAKGRRQEFKRFAAFGGDAAVARIPDPNAVSTFNDSKLKWQERELPPHQDRLRLIQDLLVLRERHLAPYLATLTEGGAFAVAGEVLKVEWRLADGVYWHLMAHFGAHATYTNMPPPGDTVYSAGALPAPEPQVRLEAGAVIVTRTRVPALALE